MKGITDSKKNFTRLGLKTVCECVNLSQPKTEKDRQAGWVSRERLNASLTCMQWESWWSYRYHRKVIMTSTLPRNRSQYPEGKHRQTTEEPTAPTLFWQYWKCLRGRRRSWSTLSLYESQPMWAAPSGTLMWKRRVTGFISTAVMKYPCNRQLGVERIWFTSWFQVIIHHCGGEKQGGVSLRDMVTTHLQPRAGLSKCMNVCLLACTQLSCFTLIQ